MKGTEDMTAAVLKAIEGTGDDEGPTEVRPARLSLLFLDGLTTSY